MWKHVAWLPASLQPKSALSGLSWFDCQAVYQPLRPEVQQLHLLPFLHHLSPSTDLFVPISAWLQTCFFYWSKMIPIHCVTLSLTLSSWGQPALYYDPQGLHSSDKAFLFHTPSPQLSSLLKPHSLCSALKTRGAFSQSRLIPKRLLSDVFIWWTPLVTSQIKCHLLRKALLDCPLQHRAPPPATHFLPPFCFIFS